MKQEKTSVALTPHELQLITAALQTQEKIYAVQSRAGTDSAAARRLDDLKSVLRNLGKHAAKRPAHRQSWSEMARTLFC